MRSFLAALRSLVLPYGQTSGKRIFLDGTTGLIQIYNAANQLVAQISPDKGFHTVDGSGNAADLVGGSLEFTGSAPSQFAWFQNGEIGFSNDGGVTSSRIDLFPDNNLHIHSQGGKTVFSEKIVKDGQDWTTIPYAGTWTTRPGFFPLAYKIMPDDMCQLRGTLTPGAINTLIATLPVGARPALNDSYPCAHDGAAANSVTRVTVATDGTITAFGMGTPGNTFSLGQVAFPIS